MCFYGIKLFVAEIARFFFDIYNYVLKMVHPILYNKTVIG